MAGIDGNGGAVEPAARRPDRAPGWTRSANRPLRMVRRQRRRPHDPGLAWLRSAWAGLAVRRLGPVVVVLVLVVAR